MASDGALAFRLQEAELNEVRPPLSCPVHARLPPHWLNQACMYACIHVCTRAYARRVYTRLFMPVQGLGPALGAGDEELGLGDAMETDQRQKPALAAQVAVRRSCLVCLACPSVGARTAEGSCSSTGSHGNRVRTGRGLE